MSIHTTMHSLGCKPTLLLGPTQVAWQAQVQLNVEPIRGSFHSLPFPLPLSSLTLSLSFLNSSTLTKERRRRKMEEGRPRLILAPLATPSPWQG